MHQRARRPGRLSDWQCLLGTLLPRAWYLSFVFCCPEQLNRWPCHWLTDRTLLIDIQRVTLETCDLWDIWSEWWGDMTFRFLEDFQIFGRFSDFWKIFRFWTIFRFLEDIQIFGRFSGFWTIPRLLTFETLFTILTIENLNLWQFLLSDN